MHTTVRKINTEYNGHKLLPLWTIQDKQSSLVLLPLLFTTHLSIHGTVYEVVNLSIDNKNIGRYVERDISDSTIRTYVYCLSKFLNHLEFCHLNFDTPNMHSSNSCSEKFINNYLNNELTSQLESFQSIQTHCAALSAYFNFLSNLNFSKPVNLRINRKTKKLISEKSNKQHYIQYISIYWRMELLNNCKTLSEKLMIRLGFEVGLRTSELMGIRVYNKNSITKLFDELDCNDKRSINRFRYKLEGIFTKRGKSRWLYFDRDLLEDMRRYFKTERKEIEFETGIKDESFFIRKDQRFKGTGIGAEQGSRVFKKRALEAGLNPHLSFHDLRHTFATELFHEEISGIDTRETRSESAALIVVSQRLGHAIGRDGKAPEVTTRYIRMRNQMMEIESQYNAEKQEN